MKTRMEVADELGCHYQTIERYEHELDMEPVKIKNRWHYYSAEQVQRMKDHQLSKKAVGKHSSKRINRPTCPQWDCAHRSDCLMTEKIYTLDCPDYEREDIMNWLENSSVMCRDVLKEKRDAI